MPISFDNTILSGVMPPQVVEEAFRIYCSFAGVHDYTFHTMFEETSESVSSSDFDTPEILSTTYVPESTLIEYDIDGLGHGVLFRYEPVLQSGIMIGIDSNSNGVVYEMDISRGTKTLKKSIPVDCPEEGHVVAYMYRERYSIDTADVWETLHIWMNDSLILSYTHFVEGVLEFQPEIGLIADANNRTFENIRIPQLSSIMEWASIDPGEPPVGGLQRSIEGRFVKYFTRYDGTVRAWESVPDSVRQIFTDDETISKAVVEDTRQHINHVRLLGAFEQAEYVSFVEGQGWHRFAEINNPYVTSPDVCFTEAQRMIRRANEQKRVLSLVTAHRPTIEPEDRIQNSDGDWIVTSVRWTFQPALIVQELQCRAYAYAG